MKTMHMKKLREKGITLIALVITIVVLIILATVAIQLSLGNNGIFNRAKTAKEQYQNAQDYEKTEIAKTKNQIDSYVDGNRNIALSDEIKNYIDNKIEESRNIEIVNFTTPSSASNWVKIADYPSGFTKDNSIMIYGYCYLDNTNENVVLPYCGSSGSSYFGLELRTSGIYGYLSSGYLSKSGKIYLQKIM